MQVRQHEVRQHDSPPQLRCGAIFYDSPPQLRRGAGVVVHDKPPPPAFGGALLLD